MHGENPGETMGTALIYTMSPLAEPAALLICYGADMFVLILITGKRTVIRPCASCADLVTMAENMLFASSQLLKPRAN